MKSYFSIDFQNLEFGYKKIHKLYEIEEMKIYHQFKLDQAEKARLEKEMKEARKKKFEYYKKKILEESEDEDGNRKRVLDRAQQQKEKELQMKLEKE